MTVVVVGAGPAGVSAVAWLRHYGLDYLWVDSAGTVGGMLFDVHNRIQDYPGLGAENGRAMAEQLAAWVGTRPEHREVFAISSATEGHAPRVHFSDGEVLDASAVILCTGTRKRRLGVPGEDAGLGRCVRQSAARDAHLFQGCTVAVVGGGDSALEGCLRLTEAGVQEVLLIARSPIRGRAEFRDRVAASPRVTTLPIGRTVTEIRQSDGECALLLDDGSVRDVAAVFVRIGVEPVAPGLDARIDLDRHGFVLVDERKSTTWPGVFAAGDVTSTPLRSIATSVADGAVAARAVAEYLEIL